MEKQVKILIDGKSCHGGAKRWSLPEKRNDTWEPGKWHHVKGNVNVCANGLHTVDYDQRFRWYDWGCTTYLAEGAGESVRQNEKTAWKRLRLIEPIPHPQWWLDCVAFVESLKTIPWGQPQGPPDPSWTVFDTLDAAWDTARYPDRYPAWDAALDAASAAVSAAARDAAWDAARSTVWRAAETAARSAAWDAAGDAAGSAARDAALWAQCIVAELAGAHREHAEARMDVWRRGYGLLCDVDGVLYVYK